MCVFLYMCVRGRTWTLDSLGCVFFDKMMWIWRGFHSHKTCIFISTFFSLSLSHSLCALLVNQRENTLQKHLVLCFFVALTEMRWLHFCWIECGKDQKEYFHSSFAFTAAVERERERAERASAQNEAEKKRVKMHTLLKHMDWLRDALYCWLSVLW